MGTAYKGSELKADQNVSAIADRLHNGIVRIVVFGVINYCKSSLLNALLGDARFVTGPSGGVTCNVSEARLSTAYTVKGYKESQVILVDTPGIGEVDGGLRGEIALDEAIKSDLILFVISNDLTDIEFNDLRTVISLGKPLLLVLNKMDNYASDALAQIKQMRKIMSIASTSPRVRGFLPLRAASVTHRS